MASTKRQAILKTDTPPDMALSLLRHRITAVEVHGDGPTVQVGQAIDFRLVHASEDGQVEDALALACTVDIDDDLWESAKPMLADGAQVYVGDHLMSRTI